MQNKTQLPIKLLALDFSGTLLCVIGLWQLVVVDNEEPGLLRHWAIPLIVIGLLMMVPFILWVIKMANSTIK